MKEAIEKLHFRKVITQLMLYAGGMSESELARRTGIKQQTVHRLLSGATPDPRILTLMPIANYFNVTMGQLLGHEPIASSRMEGDARSVGSYTQIPLLVWEQVIQWKSLIPTLDNSNWLDWLTVNLSVSKYTYGLKIYNRSLPCPFSYGTIIIVDPDRHYQDNDTVVICDNKQSAKLRRIFLDGEITCIADLNDDNPPCRIKDPLDICGVIVQTQSILAR